MSQLVLEWKPRNITEWIFVRDIADISWEIFRHRRAIANTFAVSFRRALERIFKDELDNFWKAEDLAGAWFNGPKEQEKVKLELAKYGLSPEVIVAQCYSIKGD